MKTAADSSSTRRKSWPLLVLACTALGFGLVGIGDQYPFSPFPMYSNVEPSADVLYVTDQGDKVLAISSLFDVGSAQGKKRFEKELLIASGTRDYEKAPVEKVAKAAETFLEKLWKDRKAKKVDALGLRQLKAHIITVSLDDKSAFKQEDHMLGHFSIGENANANPSTAPAP